MSDGDWDKVDRYLAFYTCLTKGDCSDLQALASKEEEKRGKCVTFEAYVDGSDLLKVQGGQMTLAHRNFNGIGAHGNCDSSFWDKIKINGVSHAVSLSGASYSIDRRASLGMDINALTSFEPTASRGTVKWAGTNQILIDDDPIGSRSVYSIKLCGC